jgi:hypothetical protein
VNNKFLGIVKTEDGFLNIPLEIDFDFEGRSQSIELYESDVLAQIINPPQDFESTKFAHAEWNYVATGFTINLVAGPFGVTIPMVTLTTTTTKVTNINYEFNLFDYLSTISGATLSNWAVDYENASFTDSEIYYFANSFKGSFFKLDFYDTNESESQKILLTIILPTQQGLKESGTIGSVNAPINVMVKKPKFKLDYTGADKEGFFIYFLKDKSYLNLDEFYVSAKFFNAKKGQFVRLMNVPQSNFVGASRFNVDKQKTFYYKYKLNYQTFEYEVFYEAQVGNITRVGTINSPIKWYEYVNPR